MPQNLLAIWNLCETVSPGSRRAVVPLMMIGERKDMHKMSI